MVSDRAFDIATFSIWNNLTIQYNTNLFIWQPSAGLKEKQSHTNKETHSKLHYWKLVKENGIKEF